MEFVLKLTRLWRKSKSETMLIPRRHEAHFGDRVFYWILKAFSWALIFLLFGIVLLLFNLALPALHTFGLKFFIDSQWNPPLDKFGALPFIYGTMMTSLLALLMAAPISIGVAVFLTELAPKAVARVIGFLVEMLAAIPSIVYGLWGVFVLSPLLANRFFPFLESCLGPETLFAKVIGHTLTVLGLPVVFIANLTGLSNISLNELSLLTNHFAGRLFTDPGSGGRGIFTAGLVLAIMIVPTISAICREVFKTVNSSIKEASLALGATRWEMIKMAILKTSRSGILGAIILGLGRALGETMAVTMVIGNRNEIAAALLAPGQTMSSIIANEYPEASGVHMASLAAIGLALFGVSLVINSIARLVIWRVEKGGVAQ